MFKISANLPCLFVLMVDELYYTETPNDVGSKEISLDIIKHKFKNYVTTNISLSYHS